MDDDNPKPANTLPTHPLTALFADPPWATPSFLTAGATTLAGLTAWLNDLMSPALARGGASFLGGFVIGWAFRKTLQIAFLITGFLVALLAALKTAGWIQVDWSVVEADLSRSLAWAQGQAGSFITVLNGYLPSAGAGGAGAYFGFRKK
jgi:uncharacterized membrane protein (Fun14 family)